MGKVEENKKQKQEALLNSAYELFTDKGPAKTTITEIVEHAGVAKGTFYLYFKDKYDICNHLIMYKLNEIFTNAYEALLLTNLATFKEQLLFVVNSSIDYLENDPCLLAFIAKNLSSGLFNKPYEETASTRTLSYCETCLEMLSSDRDEYVKPELMLYTIFELINATCYSCILYKKPVTMKEYRPYLQRAINAIMLSFLKQNHDEEDVIQ